MNLREVMQDSDDQIRHSAAATIAMIHANEALWSKDVHLVRPMYLPPTEGRAAAAGALQRLAGLSASRESAGACRWSGAIAESAQHPRPRRARRSRRSES
jgi:hypothetical protein